MVWSNTLKQTFCSVVMAYLIFLYKYQHIFAFIYSDAWYNDNENTLTYVRSFQINVRVTTMDAELEFAIQSVTSGKQLFEQVSNGSRNFPNHFYIAQGGMQGNSNHVFFKLRGKLCPLYIQMREHFCSFTLPAGKITHAYTENPDAQNN